MALCKAEADSQSGRYPDVGGKAAWIRFEQSEALLELQFESVGKVVGAGGLGQL